MPPPDSLLLRSAAAIVQWTAAGCSCPRPWHGDEKSWPKVIVVVQVLAPTRVPTSVIVGRPRLTISIRQPVGMSPPDRLRSTTEVVGTAAASLVQALASAPDAASSRGAVTAAEGISTGRRILYQCLIDLGWLPPKGTVEGMLLDVRLLREGVGACHDGPPTPPVGGPSPQHHPRRLGPVTRPLR